MNKPSVFVGSSREGLEIARAVQSQLEDVGEVELWNEGVFGLSHGTLESLVQALDTFDFAVLVLTPDDLIVSHGVEHNSARDNVLIELGLFMGRLGRGRTFLLYPRDGNVKIPSDLAGVTLATFSKPSDERKLVSAVGPACSKMRHAMKAGGKAMRLGRVEERQDILESKLRTLQVAVAGTITDFEYQKLRGLAGKGPFLVRFHWEMYHELKRLDAIRYVQPQPGYGIVSVQERDGSGNEFDLKQYVRITEQGLEYLKLRDELFYASKHN
jgi:Predicted nucleotide-binding protein containing TIR-like domain